MPYDPEKVGRMVHDDQCAKHDASIADMKSDLRLLCDRVPSDLKEQLVTIKHDLEKLDLRMDTLDTDFKAGRAQWRIVLMAVITAFIAAFTGFVFKGGLKGGG
jgi:hypothetical protein